MADVQMRFEGSVRVFELDSGPRSLLHAGSGRAVLGARLDRMRELVARQRARVEAVVGG